MILLKSDEKQVMSTKALLEHFELTEEELIWYIDAARYQLANPYSWNLEHMGRPIECSYGLENPVEAVFGPIKKGEDHCSPLVALDYNRVVLFAFAGNYSYEIWLDYRQMGEDYRFYEKYYRAYMFAAAAAIDNKTLLRIGHAIREPAEGYVGAIIDRPLSIPGGN